MSADTFARFIVGDSLTVLRSLPDASVDLVLSSPPFLGLRSYLPSGHPDKRHEIGSEGTPGAFIDVLLDITEECRRVLAPHGSLCFELGDTYAGSGGAGGDYNAEGLRSGQEKFSGSAAKRRKLGPPENDRPPRYRTPGPDPRYKQRGEQSMGTGAGGDWPLDKSLCLIPESFRWALVYGRNPFTGRETPRWRARNVVRWCRPNPPVGALADKVRPATSDIIVACTGRSRYFDLDGIREPGSENTHARTARGVESRESTGKTADDERRGGNWSTLDTLHTTNGAPPLDHWWYDEDDTFDQDAWMVSTEPYHGSHYATWPRSLLVRPIVAMCPPKVCTVCGKPSERIAVTTNAIGEAAGRRSWRAGTEGIGAGHSGDITRSVSSAPSAERETVGWTDCGHDSWRAGVVLDPFGGSGTTAVVATGHGRSALLIDLDERNADLARERVGMFLTVEVHSASVA